MFRHGWEEFPPTPTSLSHTHCSYYLGNDKSDDLVPQKGCLYCLAVDGDGAGGPVGRVGLDKYEYSVGALNLE